MTNDKQIKILNSRYEHLRREYATYRRKTIKFMQITLDLLRGLKMSDKDILKYYEVIQNETGIN